MTLLAIALSIQASLAISQDGGQNISDHGPVNVLDLLLKLMLLQKMLQILKTLLKIVVETRLFTKLAVMDFQKSSYAQKNFF